MDLPEFLMIADGEIRLKGHRIRLIDVAARYDEGHSAESLVLDHYPSIGLALAHKVIGFYLDNEAEVNELIRENVQEIERQMARPRGAPTLAELRARLR